MNSVIFVILSAIFYCYSNSAISPATVLIHCATVLRHFATLLRHFYSAGIFMILLAIFHCYSTQSFFTATVLSHFPVLQCSVIYDPVSHFRVARMGSGSREGAWLNCVRARGSIGYARRTELRVRWSRPRHGVGCVPVSVGLGEPLGPGDGPLVEIDDVVDLAIIDSKIQRLPP
jgi:hypothetical protein